MSVHFGSLSLFGGEQEGGSQAQRTKGLQLKQLNQEPFRLYTIPNESETASNREGGENKDKERAE